MGGAAASPVRIDLLVLCADDFQDPPVWFRKRVLHCPFIDTETPIPTGLLAQIVRASQEAAEAIRQGQSVMICCAAGLNRSGLVVALTLRELTGCSGPDAINTIRARRHPLALNNRTFIQYILGYKREGSAGRQHDPT